MDREEALQAVKSKVSNPNLVKHMLASEAVMRALAQRLGENEGEWGLAGLLHDIDLDIVGDDPARHSKVSAQMAREMGVSAVVANAILRHNERHGEPRETMMDKAMFCADPLTGMITAAALVRPDRLNSLEAKSVIKRMKEKSFAAGVNREQLATCSELGLPIEEFVSLGIQAMKGISADLGL